ncbi:MAG: hypothetical protein O6926_08005 [candidate division NC10 bacterium]|nr:hypothetical protein [candidate division NC10 bacterium]
MERGVTYGRNTLVRSVNTRVPDDVKENTVQQLISESYAGNILEDNVRHVLATLQRVPKLIKTKKGESNLRWCIEVLREQLKEYKGRASDMSIGSAREVTVFPKPEITTDQPDSAVAKETGAFTKKEWEKLEAELMEIRDILHFLSEILTKEDKTISIGLILEMLTERVECVYCGEEEAA